MGAQAQFASLRRDIQFLHHRSLTASITSLVFAFLASAELPESDYRLGQQGADYLIQAGVVALLGLFVCALTFIILLQDNRSGYPSLRCSVATFLWALACAPVFALMGFVTSTVLR